LALGLAFCVTSPARTNLRKEKEVKLPDKVRKMGEQGRTQDTPAPVQRGAEGAAQHLGHDQHTGEEN
jgi:hypothetical protein